VDTSLWDQVLDSSSLTLLYDLNRWSSLGRTDMRLAWNCNKYEHYFLNGIADLEAENVACIRTLELRKKQFALLLHAVSLPSIIFLSTFLMFNVERDV
jgi:hypothetical protein